LKGTVTKVSLFLKVHQCSGFLDFALCGTDVPSTICSHGEYGDIVGFIYEVVEEQTHGKLGFSYEIWKFG